MTPPANEKPLNKPAEKPAATPPKKKLELNSKTIRLLLVVCLMLLAIAFTAIIFLGLSVLGSKSRGLLSLKSQSQSVDDELLNLEQSKKDVEKYAYFKDVAKTVIPNDKDQAEAVLQLFQFAKDSNMDIQSVTFPTSTLGGPNLSTGTTSGTADATSTKASSTALTQAKPVTGISNLYSLPLTVTFDSTNSVPPDQQITYPKILQFLNDIENNRRTSQITEVNIQPPSGAASSLTFSLTINIFMKS